MKAMTLTKTRKLLASKEISIKELLQESQGKVQELDSKIHAFISTNFDLALENQQNNGKLAGIPASIKDNYNWIGTKTTAGSKILKDYESPYNSTVVSKLLEEAALIVGKTNMDAFAHGSSTETSDFFTTLNPYDYTRVAGGSSGGSSASVASGMCIYSIGSETAGSVRGPASWCGVVGFVPTYGRISRYGLIAMGSSLDRPGSFTNSVEDVALLLKILSGKDQKDATTIQEENLDLKLKEIKKLKIGIPKEYMDERVNSEVRKRVLEVSELLKKEGHEITEISLLDPKYAMAVYTIVCRSEVSSNLARIDGIRYGHVSETNAENILEQISLNRAEGFGNEAKQRSMTGAYTLSAGYYDAYYKKAQKVRTLINNDFQKVFREIDIILAPTMPDVAPKLGVTQNNPIFGELADILTEASALAGLPCISIPAGFNSQKLPIGVQLIGKQFDEEGVLNTAYLIEKLLK